MENFILSGTSYDANRQTLSFFASAIQRNINQGTEEMLREMLTDLGLSHSNYHSWTKQHFITHYLMDYFCGISDDWRNNWSHTWEITLQLKEPVFVQPSTDLTRTYARDATASRSMQLFPALCIIIADFYDTDNLQRAIQLFKLLQLYNGIELTEQVAAIALQLSSPINQLDKWRETHQEKTEDLFTTTQRSGYPLQLLISLGLQEAPFFDNGAGAAELVVTLIRQLSGTITWDERTDIKR